MLSPSHFRDAIKDLAWRGRDEKRKAEQEYRSKESDIRKARLETENFVISHRLENEKSALEIESQRVELRKNQLDVILKEFEVLEKFSGLNLELGQKEILAITVQLQISALSSNPITPLLGSEIAQTSLHRPDAHIESLTDELLHLLDRKSKDQP